MRRMVDVRRLIFDDWNVEHIARHGVTQEEVEQVCRGDHIVQTGYRGRLVLIGATSTSRMLAVVLAQQDEGEFYPVTARPASRKERKQYASEKGRQAHDDETDRE